MENKRLFISIPVDPATSKEIFKHFSELKLPWEKLKKVPQDQIHLTLKFLGDTPIDKLPEIIQSLETVELKEKDLEISINKSLIFNERQPKVLVLGIKKNEQLESLYEKIEEILFDDGLAHKEIRRFSAHITLARVKQSADFDEFKSFLSWDIKKTFFVPFFELKESILSKTGPEHNTLQTFDL